MGGVEAWPVAIGDSAAARMGKFQAAMLLGVGLAACAERRLPPAPPPEPSPPVDSAPLLRVELHDREALEPPAAPGGAAPKSAAARQPITELRLAGARIALLAAGQALEQALEAKARIDVVLERTSDLGAIERIAAGQADAALIARRLTPAEASAGLFEIELGHHVVALAVHREQPIAGASRDRLREVLTGQRRDWQDLGGPPRALELLILPLGPWSDHAAALLIPGDRFWFGARTMRTEVAILDHVARARGALGIVSARALELHGQARALAIDGALPDLAGFLSGRYPYGATLCLVHGRQPPAAVRELVRFVHSEDGTLVLGACLLR
jgi:ABC-type phosphate transport system substrate-binding protein